MTDAGDEQGVVVFAELLGLESGLIFDLYILIFDLSYLRLGLFVVALLLRCGSLSLQTPVALLE